MAWQVGGYRYRETQELAGGATYTNVNKHLVRARARLRRLAEEASEWTAHGPDEKGGVPMAIGTCRRDGCDNPRRMRRGLVEPLCEDCYRRAMDKVARELAEEAATDGRARYRKMKLAAGARPADRAPERVAPVARAGARPFDGRARSLRPVRAGDASAGSRTRCISEELLCEARRLYGLGLSLRAVAEALLGETSYANAHSAEVALRFQFKRRGWPLRTSAQARRARRAPEGEDLARAG